MSRRASNWVDRDEPLEHTLARVLGHPLGMAPDDPRLTEHVLTIRGQVEADATEVHVAAYVRSLFPLFELADIEGSASRILGIALWHIAKAGLVRDRARRQLALADAQRPPGPRLADQLATAIANAPVYPPTRESATPRDPLDIAARLRRDRG